MRILHISKFAHPVRGGIETFVRDLTAEQARQGHLVNILCHHEKPRQPMVTDVVDEVRVIRSPILCCTPFAPYPPSFTANLRRAVSSLRPDVIHLHLPNPAALSQRALPRRVPLVVHWHADVQGSSRRLVNALYPAYRYFEKRCLSKASRIIATSMAYLASSPTLTRWRSKCAVVPLGIDPARYPVAQGNGKSRDPLVLGVGRFVFYKGFKDLVQAAYLTPEASFIIAGDGPEHLRLEREIDRLGLSGRVHLPGAVSDAELARLLQHATLFCLPSTERAEAFGVALLEAMRYGLPLLSTAIPGSGVGWVNQDGITGRVVPPGDPQALAEAIDDMLSEPEMMRKYGIEAKQRFDREFCIAQIARAVNRVYLDALGSR